MWFISPQLTDLGFSSTAQFYAIKSIDEAAAYLAHPVLGARLIECCEALLFHPARSAEEEVHFDGAHGLNFRIDLVLK